MLIYPVLSPPSDDAREGVVSADPRESHATAVKRIGKYLLATKDKGLILNPKDHSFDCWVDADFVGNYHSFPLCFSQSPVGISALCSKEIGRADSEVTGTKCWNAGTVTQNTMPK
jgi:hypothetical protein